MDNATDEQFIYFKEHGTIPGVKCTDLSIKRNYRRVEIWDLIGLDAYDIAEKLGRDRNDVLDYVTDEHFLYFKEHGSLPREVRVKSASKRDSETS